ncbi:hypothetical protein [Streptomyces sp. NPDC052811]|uniref:hypothetical protein n=1 Tax=Streptomyces sp. NPDC052811 TaxID=3155731 RepID=UPI00342F1327
MAESSVMADADGTAEQAAQAEEAAREASFARLVELRKAFLASTTFEHAAAVQTAVTEHAARFNVNRFEVNVAITKAAHDA